MSNTTLVRMVVRFLFAVRRFQRGHGFGNILSGVVRRLGASILPNLCREHGKNAADWYGDGR